MASVEQQQPDVTGNGGGDGDSGSGSGQRESHDPGREPGDG